jgi:DNA-binding response OmpR family regulator
MKLRTSESKVKLILVDDDLDLLCLMSLKLEREGFAVNVSHNGDKLAEIIEAAQPDAVLLDIQMKGINGGDICKKLKADDETRQLYVALVSSTQDIKEIAFSCGADSYFPKPVDIHLLAEKIKSGCS